MLKDKLKGARKFARMFTPVFADNISVHLMNMVTSAMVSNIGEHAISATSMVGTVQTIATTMFGAITTGAIVRISQNIGAQDKDATEKTARQSIMLCMSIAVTVSLLLMVFGNPLLGFIFGNADAKILGAAKEYLLLSAISLPFYALFSVSNGIMYGTGDFKKTMRNSMLLNVLYLLLSALFIKVFGMGVAGAGLALIICRAMCGVFTYWLLRRGTGLIQIRSAIVRPDYKTVVSVLKISIPAAVDNLIICGSNLLVQSCVTSLGSSAIAANAIANTMSGFLLMTGNSVATVSVTVIGQAYGARDMKRCRRYMRYMLIIAIFAVGFTSSLAAIFRNFLIGVYASEQETFLLARRVLSMMVCLYPLLWPTAFISSAMLRGCGDVKYSTAVSTSLIICVRAPTAWIFSIYLGWGLMGVWISMMTEWALRTALILPRVFSHRWEYKAQE